MQFVINYEEGSENNILHGDAAAEGFMSEVSAIAPMPGRRNVSVETMYEYSSRAGFWRLYRIFTERRVPVTVYGIAMALERNLEAVAAMNEADWEIASHGYRWIDYQTMAIDQEREHMAKAIEVHTRVTGSRLHGRLVGRPGRAASLMRFFDYVLEHEKVWLCRRIDMAEHWYVNHPPT